MVTKENSLQFAEICKWIADGECQFLDAGGAWRDVSASCKCDFSHPPDSYRRRPRKAVRNMTIEEVIALGNFVRRISDLVGPYRYTTGLYCDNQRDLDTWIKRGDTYTTDGGRTWHPFTIEESK